jgi:hypothetical protein
VLAQTRWHDWRSAFHRAVGVRQGVGTTRTGDPESRQMRLRRTFVHSRAQARSIRPMQRPAHEDTDRHIWPPCSSPECRKQSHRRDRPLEWSGASDGLRSGWALLCLRLRTHVLQCRCRAHAQTRRRPAWSPAKTRQPSAVEILDACQQGSPHCRHAQQRARRVRPTYTTRATFGCEYGVDSRDSIALVAHHGY